MNKFAIPFVIVSLVLLVWMLAEIFGPSADGEFYTQSQSLGGAQWGVGGQPSNFASYGNSSGAMAVLSQGGLEELVEETKMNYTNKRGQSLHNSSLEAGGRLTERDLYFDRRGEVFHIGSIEGLGVMRDIVNGVNTQEVLGYFPLQDNVLNNLHVVLDNDIDMSVVSNWYPFQSYVGVFDGKGYEISNLKALGTGYNGLFRSFGQKGYKRSVLKNLTIKNAFVSEAVRCGAFAGTIVNSLIQNCEYIDSSYKMGRISVEAENRAGYAGGVAGTMEDVVALYCGVKGNVKKNRSYSEVFSGQVKQSTFVGCYTVSIGDVTGGVHAFAGIPKNSRSIFVGCVSLYGNSQGHQTATGHNVWGNDVAKTGSIVLSCYGGKSLKKTIVPYLAKVNSACESWFKDQRKYSQSAKLMCDTSGIRFMKIEH